MKLTSGNIVKIGDMVSADTSRALPVKLLFALMIGNTLSTTDLRAIQSMVSFLNQENDKCVWTATSDGKFTVKSAWGRCRNRNTEAGLFCCGDFLKTMFLLMNV